MSKVLISKWGNSLAVRLPKQFTEQLCLVEGQSMEMSVEGTGISMQPEVPPRIPRYRLEDLVAQMNPDNIPPFEDWGPDVGAEIIDDDYSRGLIPKPS